MVRVSGMSDGVAVASIRQELKAKTYRASPVSIQSKAMGSAGGFILDHGGGIIDQ